VFAGPVGQGVGRGPWPATPWALP